MSEFATSKAPVEVTTRYVTSVDNLPDAWAFVMDRLDLVGPEPTVEIRPRHIFSIAEAAAADWRDDQEPTVMFEVVVSGMIQEGQG